MKNEYTAIVKQEGTWWIGWIAEILGVNCQETTYEELKETLEVTLREALEFNRHDSLDSWWYNPLLNRRPAIPRHSEIKDILAHKFCKDLDVRPIK
jgi:predicted RNase H-like HicB family nuclease